MSDRELATAADYADAMLTARRAKQALVLVLLLMLLGQLGLFFATRYSQNLLPHLDNVAASAAASQPVKVDAGGMPTVTNPRAQQVIEYTTSLCLFLGIVFSVLLSLVLLLIVNIMLVGRLIGVGRVASAYLWCLLLMLLLFPWQAFLNDVHLTSDLATFKIPGVFYTWNELSSPTAGAHFPTDDLATAALKWTRYVVAPVVAILILLVVQIKSNRGIRQALGEDTLLVDESLHA